MPLHGTWKVTGGGPDIPVLPVAAAVVATAATLAFLAWLAAHMLAVAIIAAVVIAALVAGCRWMRRRYPDYSPSVARQAAALRADMARPAVVEHHHYVHTLPGETAGDASWAPLVRGTVDHMED